MTNPFLFASAFYGPVVIKNPFLLIGRPKDGILFTNAFCFSATMQPFKQLAIPNWKKILAKLKRAVHMQAISEKKIPVLRDLLASVDVIELVSRKKPWGPGKLERCRGWATKTLWTGVSMNKKDEFMFQQTGINRKDLLWKFL